MATAQVLARLVTEPLFPLKSPSLYGADIFPGTAWKYYKRGCRSIVNGKRFFLEAIFQGKALYTSREAYQRFLLAINSEPNPPTRSRRRPRRRK